MRFRPLHDRLMVSRLHEQDKIAGDIEIPDKVKEKPMEACVIAIGPGPCARDGQVLPMSVSVGDHILIGKWSGTEVKIDKDEFLIPREEDILVVIEKAEALAKAA